MVNPTPHPLDRMLHSIEFFVPGQPKPQGSKRHVGHGIMLEQSNLRPWRQTVALAALDAMTQAKFPLLAPPINIELEFVFPRLASGPKWKTKPMTSAPDLDKLCRAVLDGLTGAAIANDAHVHRLRALKRRAKPGEPHGVHVQLAEEEP